MKIFSKNMGDQNLNSSKLEYSEDSLDASTLWWKIALVGTLHVPTNVLLRFVIGGAVINSSESAFRGISGLALGLVFIKVLGVLTFLLTTFLTGLILKRWTHLSRPYLTAIIGTFVTYIITYVITLSLSLLGFSLPNFVAIPSALISSACGYVLAWKLLDKPKHPVLIISIVFTAFLLLSSASLYLSSYQYGKARLEEKQDRAFSIYAPDPSYFDESSIKNSNSITTVVAITELDTPQGRIEVRQTGLDENLANMFIPPDKCDYPAINDYIDLFERKKYPNPTDKKCDVVYQSDDRVVMMADPEDEEILSDTPFVARVNNTIIVFHVYSSELGKFQGTPGNVKGHVVDYIRDSRVINNSEIGL